MWTLARPVLAAALGAVILALSACGGTTAPEKKPTPSVDAKALFRQELHDRLPQSVKDAGEIVFAGDPHPPYRVVAKDGTVTGFDPDLQAALGAVLGVKTRIEVIAGLPAALTGMKAKRFDAFNGPVKDTAKREVDFDNVVYMTSRTAYLFKADAKVKAAGDLCGATVAYVSGSIVEGQLEALSSWCGKQGKPAVKGQPLADTNATILSVRSGRADALGATQAGVLDIVNAGDKGAFRYVLQEDAQGAGVDQLALLAPKAGGLGPVIFEAFKVLFETGTYDELMKRYGLTDVAVDAPAMNVAGKA
ncbi:transporter substrate-binding domain-containing protein [Cryptosporangium aurantiacum]|uniref:Amino acid ABC transporter substrate-binding protein, PAAT family n=1 Tax=Cryptosporangium aurantiacum TaxID=134849 RepID=A0A1M7TVT3_9ACTN|nr:transporter substrate-binding domain-containing protein [Cryptosporangium aurantiacum]SHN74837.1 amino acid ABC transporter substrate-binding protein, PAAT family [Cryptosporangium aurantiacum]